MISPIVHTKRIVIIGGGRSLNGFSFGLLHREDCFIITINESGKHAPFADAWFTLDPWGLYGPQLPGHRFKGQLYAAVPEDFATPESKIRNHRIKPTADIKCLRRVHGDGLSEDPTTIHTGNSGYGALGLAYHMRPEKILLLGIDGDIGYYYTTTRTNNALDHLPDLFEGAVPQLRDAGITVINGSPNSSVTSFPRYTPHYALQEFLK
jgi:hypothetical protein